MQFSVLSVKKLNVENKCIVYLVCAYINHITLKPEPIKVYINTYNTDQHIFPSRYQLYETVAEEMPLNQEEISAF